MSTSNPGPSVTTGSTDIGLGSPQTLGTSATSLVGFYGKTPIVQPSVTWPNTATATTTLNETKCNRLMAALVALGIIVTT
jgi:hypothetical protein